MKSAVEGRSGARETRVADSVDPGRSLGAETRSEGELGFGLLSVTLAAISLWTAYEVLQLVASRFDPGSFYGLLAVLGLAGYGLWGSLRHELFGAERTV